MISPEKLQGIVDRARVLAASVPDPEIPVITIEELGILRDVQAVPFGEATADGQQGYLVEITITPTYSGCPAMDQIRDDILNEMDAEDIPARIKTSLAPAWTTDWMSDAAKLKLREYGIAPPQHLSNEYGNANAIQFAPKSIAARAMSTKANGAFSSKTIICPHCSSDNTTETSHFASTACKALYKCLDCLEPFDYFKPY
ncbi:1,2-phenylacetyl-CoA epoxidase subunit PaaD [Variovorax sp. PCZ-1]|uniref:1,2-phenylacetyl-CoA epoxidase subunit PaaD n=1 Tax=Variovorax sp. PCZ-1 TaxID=2835533 RepID=UPI0032DFEBDD